MKIEQVINKTDRIEVLWSDGHRAEFVAEWLLDNSEDELTTHPKTKQRLVPFIEQPIRPQIAGIETTDEEVKIKWKNWEHEGCYSQRLLREFSTPRRVHEPVLWGGDQTQKFCTFSFLDINRDDSCFYRCLKHFLDYGFVRILDVPNKVGQVLKIAEMFGYVRETNFGRLFDVKAAQDPDHLAYTNVGLALHTDNGYRYATPSVQLLHCLKNSAEGGESTLLDGFYAASCFKQNYPSEFEVIDQTPVGFRYRDGQTDLFEQKPLIEMRADGRFYGVYFNDRTRTPLNLSPEKTKRFYEAYRLFCRFMQNVTDEYEFRMQKGEVLIFHNTRVLHGRKEYAGEGGERHLQGCYSDIDAYYSRLRVLQRKLGKPLLFN